MTAKFNKTLFLILVIVALLPLIPSVLNGAAALSPVALAIAILFGLAAFRPLWRGGGGLLKGLFSALFAMTKGFFAALGWLFGVTAPSARFMGLFERWALLSSANQGVLVDGVSSRLSEQASYESLLIEGGVGTGKSSTFVLPNLLQPPSHAPSFVISDTSGEIYQKSSGYLARRGYRIRILNLMDLRQSETFNPLETTTSPQQIADLAKTLVASATGRSARAAADPFWEQAAEKLIRILAQCLLNQPDPRLRNLANLQHLITRFDAHAVPKGQLGKIDRFVLAATQNDPGTFAGYQAFTQGNLKAIQSVLMTADVALDPIATPEMAALTATSSLNFADLRQGKTALYVMVNQTQMDHYAFLLNLFYAELFRSLLQNQQSPGRPVWLFLDEFGHLKIPGFEVFATTARKYKVAFALFVQSMAQLESRYGRADAQVIREGLGTEIYLPGMGLDTARELEARLGRRKSGPLMPAHEIIRMEEHEALMLHSNALPVKLSTRRYYQRTSLRWRSNRRPAPLPQTPSTPPPLVPL